MNVVEDDTPWGGHGRLKSGKRHTGLYPPPVILVAEARDPRSSFIFQKLLTLSDVTGSI